METIDEVLAHYGVKGMHWGVRKGVKGKVETAKSHLKKEVAERTSTETTVRTKPGSMVRVVGGTKRLPHDDAINARIAEQIAKKNTLDALSNKDLQTLVTRMNLESQYRQLAVKETRTSAGERLARQLLDEKGDAAFAMLGPHAAIGKKVTEQVFKSATSNKALQGGSTDKKDKKK
jgi:hypothetical protein